MDEVLENAAGRVFSDHEDDAAALWRALDETGIARAAARGAGLSAADVFGLLRLSGSRATPVPLAETLMAARLLAAAGIDQPAGRLTLAAGGFFAHGRLTADLRAVPFAPATDALALLAQSEDGPAVLLLSLAEADAAPARHLGLDPAADLLFAAVRPLAAAPAPWGAEEMRADCALARAAQMVGAMEAVLDMTLDHAATREQFGRPLARFQAIQHKLAEMAQEAAAAGAAVEAAVEIAGPETPPGADAAAIAKLRASEAAGIVAAHAHQTHGAIGIAAEHPLHLFTRRLWRWRDEFGDENDWALSLGRAAAAPDAPRLRDLILGET